MKIEHGLSAPQWAWEVQDVSPTEKLVLLALASFQITHDGMTSPSKAELASRCCMGKRTVDMAIASLIEKGYLKRYARHTDSGDQMSNIYHLQLDRQE